MVDATFPRSRERATAAAAAAENLYPVAAAHPLGDDDVFEAMRAIWNERCADHGIAKIREARFWPESRKQRAAIFWRAQLDQKIEKWEKLIEHMLTKKLMVGKEKPKDGYSQPWCVTFDWVINPENLTKLVEGHY